MITVKHVIGKQETIHPAPFGVGFSDQEGRSLAIYKNEIDGSVNEVNVLYNGHAYVMNDLGSTVGTYGLDQRPESPAAE